MSSAVPAAVAVAAVAPAAAQPPTPQELPQLEQPSPSQLDADPNVQSAIRFLQDPRVRNSPLESQIRFLKGKNMTDVQIRHAFMKVGKAVTAEKVASVRAPASMNVAGGAVATPVKARQLSPVDAPPPQPQYSQTLFPRTPPPPQGELQAKGMDWRDVVIGTGAAILAGVVGCKLFNRYSPYEIRRKSEKKPTRAFRGPYAARPRAVLNGSSESEADASSFPPSQLRAPPLPPPPTTPAALEQAAAGAAAVPAGDAEELNKLQTQLDETREALTNERKKCADLAVSSAKIRAEKQQLSRANDRLTQQIDALKKDIEKLEAEKAAAVGEGTLTATEEEPPKSFYPSLTKDAEDARSSPVAVSPVTTAVPLNAATMGQAPPTVVPEPATVTPAAPTAGAPAVMPVAAAAAAATAAVVASPQAAELPTATSTSSPPPAVEVASAPAPAPAAAADAAPASALAAEGATPVNLAALVPPAFLTPDPVNPENVSADAAN